MDLYLSIVLCFMMSLLFSWNNSSLFISGLISSGLAKFRRLAFFITASMMIGLMLEGWKMNPGKIVIPQLFTISIIAVSVTLLICNLLKVPVSISNIAVASLIGVSLSMNMQIDQTFVVKTFLAWVLTPLAALILTPLTYSMLAKLFSHLGEDLTYLSTRILIYSASFYGAYTISANNLGFLLPTICQSYEPVYIIAFIGVFLGTYLFSEKVSYTIGGRLAILSPLQLSSSLLTSSLLLWILTQIAIPAALTQIMLGSLIGSAFSSPISIINVRLLRKIAALWMLSFFLGLAISFLLGVMLK